MTLAILYPEKVVFLADIFFQQSLFHFIYTNKCKIVINCMEQEKKWCCITCEEQKELDEKGTAV